MASNKTYSTSNAEVLKKLNATNNVVTRNSYKQILKNRTARGDA